MKHLSGKYLVYLCGSRVTLISLFWVRKRCMTLVGRILIPCKRHKELRLMWISGVPQWIQLALFCVMDTIHCADDWRDHVESASVSEQMDPPLEVSVNSVWALTVHNRGLIRKLLPFIFILLDGRPAPKIFIEKKYSSWRSCDRSGLRSDSDL